MVYHDFHWLPIATKLLTAKLHSRHVKELSRKFWKGQTFYLWLCTAGGDACTGSSTSNSLYDEKNWAPQLFKAFNLGMGSWYADREYLSTLAALVV